MTPAAEAAWEACKHVLVGTLEDHGDALAAFLEVVTDAIAPIAAPHRRKIRAELFALAAELRKQGASSINDTTEAL
jgi:hypothetical protein